MNLKIVVSSVLLLMPPAVDVHADGGSGRIGFVGQIVDSSCEVGRAGSVDFAGHSQAVVVSPQLTLTVSTAGNVCRHGSIPFMTRFEPLLASDANVDSRSDKGIVTITYL